MNTRRFSLRAALAAVAAAALISGVAWRGLAATPTPNPAVAQAQAAPSVTGRALPAGSRDSYADVVKAVAPAVVTIRVEGQARVAPSMLPDDDLLRRFFGEFKSAGGEGIEVVTGSHSQAQYAEFARVAREFGFLASRGSDFHGPDESAIDLGMLPPLPGDLKPVWHDW